MSRCHFHSLDGDVVAAPRPLVLLGNVSLDHREVLGLTRQRLGGALDRSRENSGEFLESLPHGQWRHPQVLGRAQDGLWPVGGSDYFVVAYAHDYAGFFDAATTARRTAGNCMPAAVAADERPL